MTSARRQLVLWGILMTLLVCADLWAWGMLASSRSSAQRAQSDSLRCRQLAGQIMQRRSRPNVAAMEELASSELASRVERAAATAQVPAAGIVRISPEPTRRLGDSPYLESPTQLQLRQVTLKQLTVLLQELLKDSSALELRSLRLSAPREQETGPQWNVEAMICHLVYSPRNPAGTMRSER